MLMGQFFTVALANVESIKQNPKDVWNWAIFALTIGAGLTNTWRAYYAMPTGSLTEELALASKDGARLLLFFVLVSCVVTLLR